MKGTISRLGGVALAMSGCLPSYSGAADSTANNTEVEQLRQQLGNLSQRYEAQNKALLALSERLQQLESSGKAQVKPARFVKTAAVSATGGSSQPSGEQPASQPVTGQVAATGGSQPSAEEEQPARDGGEKVVKEAPASRSVQAIYREQDALFNQTFTLEPGLSYTHSDRRELILNGFLALDAIFLGNLNLDRVKSDIVQLDVTGRYGVTDRLQFDFNAPFLYRTSTFQSGGVGGSAAALGEEDVNQSDIGDVSAGVFYRFFAGELAWPDIVGNLRVKAPTGKDPFGIKIVPVPGNNNLSIPEDLPTGNGVWTASAGLTFLKTVDPAILFANVGYAYNFIQSFDDISPQQGTKTPGEVDLGDSLQLGAGIAFAVNERTSISMSYAHRFAEQSRTKLKGGDWGDVIGSDISAGSLNLGATYAMTDRFWTVANVSVGVTPDAPDITVGLKFPYNF